MNTADLARIPSLMFPEKECIYYEGKRFSYQELMDRVNRLAVALSNLGVQRGDKVAIIQTNCNEYIEAYFAVSLLGGVYIPLNFRAKHEELVYMLNNSESCVLISGARYVPLARAMQPELPLVRHYVSLEGPQDGMLDYDQILAEADPDAVYGVEADLDGPDLNMLMYTSGTTALPKGVMLTVGGFWDYITSATDPTGDEASAMLIAAPLYHIAGFSSMLLSMYGTRRLIVMRQFEARTWLELAQQERVTNAFLVPSMLKMLIEEPDFDKFDLSTIQAISYGGAPMPVPVLRRVIEQLPSHVQYTNAFGQTETTSTVLLLGPEDHRLEGTPEEIEKKVERLGSIGKPVAGVTIEILDDDGKPVPAGTVGEIAIQVPRAMSGYWKREEDTAATLVDGWIRTRDMGWVDEAGYIFLAGRKSDMIVRAGENVAPEQVEAVLHLHPKVEEAAVIGMPDPEWGEKVAAIIVLKRNEQATADEIISFCKQRMASYKAPEFIDFIDELPRNPLGKILKKDLRDRYKVGSYRDTLIQST